tara:strand:- start:1234 stop:1875 length:642 start_codon:yes stop_codon:yes gene_type:complete
MMVENRHTLPRGVQIIRKSDPLFRAMMMACVLQAKGEQDTTALIAQLASELARDISGDYILMSDEDILGPLPSRFKYNPLYGGAMSYLPLIQSAFRAAGHDIQFVFYIRTYMDWLRSLYRFQYADQPDRAFAPKRYKQKRNLPDDWVALREQLTHALGSDGVTFIDYQTDRQNGHLGTALFKMCGMSDAQINALHWIDPVNVTRPETIDPKNW